jgi:hypothetical protein
LLGVAGLGGALVCYFVYFLIFVCFYYLMCVYLSHASLQPCLISHNVYSMAYVNVIAMMHLINKLVSKLLTITVWRKGGDFCFCLKKDTPVLVLLLFRFLYGPNDYKFTIVYYRPLSITLQDRPLILQFNEQARVTKSFILSG